MWGSPCHLIKAFKMLLKYVVGVGELLLKINFYSFTKTMLLNEGTLFGLLLLF